MSRKKPKPVRKRLDPEVAARKVRALERFLADGDIDTRQFWAMKQSVLDQMLREE
jgi:hypothetical protein